MAYTKTSRLGKTGMWRTNDSVHVANCRAFGQKKTNEETPILWAKTKYPLNDGLLYCNYHIIEITVL